MASFEQLCYCKNCKKNVAVNNGKCKTCGSTQLNKTWSTRFRYIEEDGVEKQKRLSGFSTKKEAQDAYLKFMAGVKKYEKTADVSKKLTFNDLFEEYKLYFQKHSKKSSYQSFLQRTNGHILNYFKDYKVKDITPKLILEWQNTVEKYSYNYKLHLRTTLSSLLRYAETYYGIPNQLVKVASFKKTPQKSEMRIWTPEQFELAMSHLNNFEYRVFFSALFYTGARKGEIMATSWNDWDLENNILTINKTVTKKIEGYKYWIDTPKNETSNRKIKIPNHLAEMLKELKANRHGILGKFTFGVDEPLSETSILRHLDNASKSAGLTHIRIHDLRHSHASLLISQGVSIVSIAKRLGHSNIERTLNTYAHMLPHEEDALIGVLEKQHNLLKNPNNCA